MDAILKTGMRHLVRNGSLRIHNAAADTATQREKGGILKMGAGSR